MHPAIHRFAPWILLVASFVVLSVFYDSIPSEVIIARAFFEGPNTLAPKSIFTVFRVPMIDVISAAAAALLYRKFLLAASNLAHFWLVLLYMAVVKSLLQAFEIISTPENARVFFYLTLFVVVAGISMAFYISRKNLSEVLKGLAKLSVAESIFLIILFFAYLGIAIVPLFVFQ